MHAANDVFSFAFRHVCACQARTDSSSFLNRKLCLITFELSFSCDLVKLRKIGLHLDRERLVQSANLNRIYSIFW